MSKTNVLGGVALVAVAAMLSAPLRSPAQGGMAARPKWDYEIVKDNSGDTARKWLTEKGNEGWELIHVEGSFPEAVAGGTTYTTRIFYFKRPK